MLLLMVVCYGIAAVAELGDILLVALGATRAEKALLRYVGRTRLPSDGIQAQLRRRSVVDARYRQDADDEAVTHLLDSRARWGIAVVWSRPALAPAPSATSPASASDS